MLEPVTGHRVYACATYANAATAVAPEEDCACDLLPFWVQILYREVSG